MAEVNSGQRDARPLRRPG